MEKELVLEAPQKVSNRCSSYDGDCKTMTIRQAKFCFMGCKNLGIADGICPIITKEN